MVKYYKYYMKLNQFKFIIFLLLFVFTFSFSFVSADERTLETNYPSIGGAEGIDSETTLPEYVKYIFRVSLIIVALASFAVLIYGGFIFLTSSGSPTSHGEGKNWLFSGVLGLIIALCSYIILNAINPDLLNIRLDNLTGESTTTPSTSITVDEKIFQELPAGTTIEQLLAKNIDCYNYDDEGNMTDPPAGCPCCCGDNGNEEDGGVKKMKDHDFFDCVARLDSALKIKIEELIELAEELVALYAQCSCSRCDCTNDESCAPCKGPDPCPRAKINAKIKEINKLVHGEGVTDPKYLYLDLGLARITKMRNLYKKELDRLREIENMMKNKCQYGTPLNLVKFFELRQENEYFGKEEYDDIDIRKYCIEFNCIEWKFEDDPKKKFCIKYELNDKWRLCGATTTQAIVEATGKKDIKEYFVFDGDPATFYCSLLE